MAKKRKRGRVPHVGVGQIYDVFRVVPGVPTGAEQQRLRRAEVVHVTATEATLHSIWESPDAAQFIPTVKLATVRDRRAYRLVALALDSESTVTAASPPVAPAPSHEPEAGPFPRSDGRAARMFKTGARIDDVRVGDTVEVRPTSSRHKGKIALVTVSKVTPRDIILDVGAQESGVRIHPVVGRASFREPRFNVLLELRPKDAPPPPRRAPRHYRQREYNGAPEQALVESPLAERTEELSRPAASGEQLPLLEPTPTAAPVGRLASLRAIFDEIERERDTRAAEVAPLVATLDDAMGAFVEAYLELRSYLAPKTA